MGRILAIDYGRKRTGIAVTDELQIIAHSLTTVPTHEVIGFLKNYMSQEKVDIFVVGEPKTMNNQHSESVVYINPFLKQLALTFPDTGIERMDERFTSAMASRTILESGINKKARQNKALVDKVSAVLILQSWLENREFKSRNNTLSE